MATIKLPPSGKVVLKDGKVACSCCAQPSECCPYPAQALLDGLYTYEDLPDAIDIDFIEFTKLDPPQFIGGVTQYYINSDGEYLGIEDQTPDSVWAYEGGNNACLLNDAGWEDQFADSYTVTYDSDITCLSVSSTVTRESLCVWKGIADDGTTITLEIEFGSFSDLYAWTTNAPNCGGNRRGIGMPFDQDNNLGRLNTPLGNYEDEITTGSVIHIVS